MPKKSKIPTPKVVELTIKTIRFTGKKIVISYDADSEARSIRSADNPLPEFDAALVALGPICTQVCECSPSWGNTGLRMMGIKLSQLGGVDAVSFHAQKFLTSAGKALQVVTPPRMLRDPTEVGKSNAPLSEKEAARVWEFVACAKEYLLGKRAQGQLSIETEEEVKEEAEDTLPFAGNQ